MATNFSPSSGSYVLNRFPSISQWSDTRPSWPSCLFFQTLTKDLENREKQTAKLINQLKDISDKCEDTERHKNHLLVQVEDTGVKLRESNRELEKALTELRNTQLALTEAEKKRDEFKGRAQETVRQLVWFGFY